MSVILLPECQPAPTLIESSDRYRRVCEAHYHLTHTEAAFEEWHAAEAAYQAASGQSQRMDVRAQAKALAQWERSLVVERARVIAETRAAGRLKQAARVLLSLGLAACVVGFGLLYFVLARDAQSQAQRDAIHRAEMREIARLQR